jgi:hypothetical protein
MTSPSTNNLRATLPILTAVLAATATGLVIPAAASDGHLSLLIGTFLVAAVLGALFAMPLRYLPAITLLVTLLVPTEASFVPHLLQGAALGVVPLGVWIIRAPRSTQAAPVLRALACLLGVWLILSTLLTPLHTNKGLEWLVSVGLAIVFSVISAPTGLTTQTFRKVLLNVTTALGIYALLEGFVLHRNPLFAALFEHTTWWAAQHFNASYRVTTLLGHPLVNGLVFSAAAVLSASDLVRRSRNLPALIVRFMILVGATDATHSRSATLALAVGVVVVIVFSRGGNRGWGTRRLALTIGLVLGGALLLEGLQARDESRSGKLSAEVRIAVISRAVEAVHDLGPFGAGPGESEAYRRAKRLPGWKVDLENSYAQLAVSLGPIGAALMVALLGAAVVFGLQNPLVTGEAAALLTILIAMGGFNAIEGHPPVGMLIAMFMIVIVTAPRSRSSRGKGGASIPQYSLRRQSIATSRN